MTDNLYFDIGNSTVKISYRANNEWVTPFVFKHENMPSLLEWLADLRHEFDHYIIASVVDEVARALIRGLGKGKNRRIQITDIPAAFIDYASVNSLGVDRLLAGIGAWRVTPRACVVIDVGTACTIDYIDSSGVFKGGMIMPGLEMMEKGMRKFTPNLPEVKRKIPDEWPGKSTTDCLEWGLTGSFIDSVESALERYDRFGGFDVFLTGGDVKILRKYIDRDMHWDRMLVFRGMEYISNLLEQQKSGENTNN